MSDDKNRDDLQKSPSRFRNRFRFPWCLCYCDNISERRPSLWRKSWVSSNVCERGVKPCSLAGSGVARIIIILCHVMLVDRCWLASRCPFIPMRKRFYYGMYDGMSIWVKAHLGKHRQSRTEPQSLTIVYLYGMLWRKSTPLYFVSVIFSLLHQPWCQSGRTPFMSRIFHE